jgi:rhamnosyltransferase
MPTKQNLKIKMKTATMKDMEKVLAVMTATNADTNQIRRALTALRHQIDGVIVSDNNSRPEIQESLRNLEREFAGFMTCIWNKKNRGIGAALNPGARMAMERNATWILTLDDDSTPALDMVEKMLSAYAALPAEDQEKIGLITPNYTTSRGLAFPEGAPVVNGDGGITSGQLVKTSILSKTGLWNEDLFIDGVDGEFCCRVQRQGFRTLLVPGAVLNHRLGTPTTGRFLWKTAMIPNYSPYRYYTMSRNFIYLYIRHFNDNILHNNHWYDAFWAIIIPRWLIKMVLFEKQKGEKLKMVWRGGWDGLFGRMDRVPVKN